MSSQLEDAIKNKHEKLMTAAKKVVWVRDNDSKLALSWAIDLS
jgi:hypothetical protein